MTDPFFEGNRKLMEELKATAAKFPDERRRDDAKIDALNRELASPAIPSEE